MSFASYARQLSRSASFFPAADANECERRVASMTCRGLPVSAGARAREFVGGGLGVLSTLS